MVGLSPQKGNDPLTIDVQKGDKVLSFLSGLGAALDEIARRQKKLDKLNALLGDPVSLERHIAQLGAVAEAQGKINDKVRQQQREQILLAQQGKTDSDRRLKGLRAVNEALEQQRQQLANLHAQGQPDVMRQRVGNQLKIDEAQRQLKFGESKERTQQLGLGNGLLDLFNIPDVSSKLAAFGGKLAGLGAVLSGATRAARQPSVIPEAPRSPKRIPMPEVATQPQRPAAPPNLAAPEYRQRPTLTPEYRQRPTLTEGTARALAEGAASALARRFNVPVGFAGKLPDDWRSTPKTPAPPFNIPAAAKPAANVLSGAGKAAGGLGGMLGKAGTMLATAAAGPIGVAVSAALAANGVAGNPLGKMLHQIFKQSGLAKMGPDEEGTWGGMARSIKKVAEAPFKLVAKGLNLVSAAMQGLAQPLGPIGALLQGIAKAAKWATEKLGGNFDPFKALLAGYAKGLGKVAEAAHGFLTAALPLVNKARPGVLKRFTLAVDDAAAVLGHRLSPLFEFLTKVTRTFGDALATILPSTEQFRSALSPLYDALESVKEAIKENAPEIRSFLGGVVKLTSLAVRGISAVFSVLMKALTVLKKSNHAVDIVSSARRVGQQPRRGGASGVVHHTERVRRSRL